jgi:hypothetical protein
MPYLRASYGDAQHLLTVLDTSTKPGFDREIPRYEVFGIKEAYRRFKVVFRAELGILNSYFIAAQKGGLDTLSLLASGENLFPIDLTEKAPDALFDVREAGRCLAYENATAAGFHVFRATESVLRKYYAHHTGGKPPPRVRSIKVYTRALRQHDVGTEKVLASLDQMAELHRNPLIHPEARLTQEEAYGIFGIARSVIGFMLSELPRIEPTTAMPLPGPSVESLPGPTA